MSLYKFKYIQAYIYIYKINNPIEKAVGDIQTEYPEKKQEQIRFYIKISLV